MLTLHNGQLVYLVTNLMPYFQGFSADKNMKKKTIDMYLNVKRDPEVKVELPENYRYPFVMENEETTLRCEVEGFPIDRNNLEWSFR